MSDDQNERREIEAYLQEHQLESFLGDTVNKIVKERPDDPLARLGEALRTCSQAWQKVHRVKGREILNGEALPALQVEIRTYQVSD